MKWLKWTIAAVLGTATLAGITLALLPKPIPVETALVAQGPLRTTIDEDGRTRVQDRHVVTAPLAGNLARIELEPGSAVEEGIVLALIEPIAPPLLDARARAELTARVQATEASVRQAAASIARAETRKAFTAKQADRIRALVRGGAGTQEETDTAELDAETAAKELDSARFAARVSRYELEMAKAAVERSTSDGKAGDEFEIRSPVVGTVLKILRESEGVVTAGTPLLEIADPHALEIVVDVLTSDAVTIEKSDPVVIENWGGSQPLRGHVVRVDPSAFTKVSSLGVEEQRVDVVVALDDPYETWRALGDGFAVEASIVVWEDAAAVQVPTSALVRTGEGWSVLVLEDDVARSRSIVVGNRGALAVQVVEGVSPGETIVIHPSDRVTDGTRVEAL